MKVFKFSLVPFLIALSLNGVHLHLQDFMDTQMDIIKEAVGIFKDPVDKAVVAVGNMECGHIKKMVGVDYDQVSGGWTEPDVSKLTLNFRSRNLKVTYALNMAAQLLSEQRGIDPTANLIIYIHGFTDDTTLGPNFAVVSEAFLKTAEYNILGLDASSLIRYFYLRSTTCVRFIGEKLGEVLATMVKRGLNPNSIHLIGHSLGSHIAGFTGKQFQRLTGAKVGRISGLDPAGPCFALVEQELRLNASDADFVDVIHTDAGVFGITEPIGHVDFYPNGGSGQPNCLTQTCSHLRVNRLYAESIIRLDAFPAVACISYSAFKRGWCDNDDVALMGYAANPKARGSYYLRTGDRPLFGLLERGLQYRFLSYT